MLRTMNVMAPVIATVMVVVLLVEPPALHPGERVPALRLFTARAIEGLDQEQVRDAIAWGQTGEPGWYSLHRVSPTGEQLGEQQLAGVAYTPFLRVAWAAHARRLSGRPLTAGEIPPWMSAPVVYVLLRSPVAARLNDDLGLPNVAVVPIGTATSGLSVQSTLVQPMWVSDNLAVVGRFGAAIPFSDLGVIAAYPVEVLRGDLDFVAYYRLEGAGASSSVQMRGRFDPSELRKWR